VRGITRFPVKLAPIFPTNFVFVLSTSTVGYLPPPIIFNVKLQIIETANGKHKKYIRTCVDGKQRLTSILRFIRGEIGFLDAKHKKW
jgi:hypothetical protein